MVATQEGRTFHPETTEVIIGYEFVSHLEEEELGNSSPGSAVVCAGHHVQHPDSPPISPAPVTYLERAEAASCVTQPCISFED